MIDNRLVTTILKLALDTEQVKPEEVMAVLQRRRAGSQEDKQTDNIDSEVVDSGNPSAQEISNEEGKLIEQAFQELEVEDAITEAKELKKLNIPIDLNETHQAPNTTVQKIASPWSLCKEAFKNRKQFILPPWKLQ